MSGKGQVFTPDFIFSIALFSLFLIFFGAIWNSAISSFILDDSSTQDQNRYAFSILKTTGSPENWDENNVSVPGLFDEGYLDETRIVSFSDMSLSDQRRALRVQEFYLGAEYLNGTIVSHDGEDLEVFTGPPGVRTAPENKSVYSREEIAVLKEEGKRARIKFYSWEG